MNDENSPVPLNYFLKPGFIYLAQKPTIISTVLGSCVSVCLFDRKQKIGAMNRFRYPAVTDKKKATAEFGNVATLFLIRMMEKNGSKKKNLEAQILGGAFNPETSDHDIGRENILIALKALKKEGITISSRDDGGEKGRKVVYSTSTNQLAVFKVDRLRASDWYPYQGER